MSIVGPGPYTGMGVPSGGTRFPSVLGWDNAPMDAASEASPLLGVDGQGLPVQVDWDADSPHVLVSAGTGGGKSTIARSTAVQCLTAGWRVVFLDVKRHSHRWAKPLEPVAEYASTLPDIGNALVALARELHTRNEIVEAHPGPIETAPVGPRWLIVVEEMNATLRSLKELDKRLPKGAYKASDALRDLLFMGRAAKMHVMAFAQMATARDSGGFEVLENFGTRILLRYSVQAWKWLADGCGPPQPAPRQVGRGMVCFGGRAMETQFLHVDEEDATRLVLASPEARAIAREMSPRSITGRPKVPSRWLGGEV